MDTQQLDAIAIITRRNRGPFRISIQCLARTIFEFRVFAGTRLIGTGRAATPYECEQKYHKGQYSHIEQPF